MIHIKANVVDKPTLLSTQEVSGSSNVQITHGNFKSTAQVRMSAQTAVKKHKNTLAEGLGIGVLQGQWSEASGSSGAVPPAGEEPLRLRKEFAPEKSARMCEIA